jgi:hypothetical protein
MQTLMRLVHTLIKIERSKEAVNKKVEGALISKDRRDAQKNEP